MKKIKKRVKDLVEAFQYNSERVNILGLDLLELELRVKDLEEEISKSSHLKEPSKTSSEETPLWKLVLNQNTFYNGHGQMRISELSYKEALDLCNSLTDNCNYKEDIFFMHVFPETGGVVSGSIYQSCGKEDGSDKLWLGVGKIT